MTKIIQVLDKVLATGSPWLKKAYEAFADVRKQTEQYSEDEINEAIDQALKAVRKSPD